MQPQVGVIMGSKSDWPCLQRTAELLDELGVSYTVEVVSAHRTPNKLFDFAQNAQAQGLQVIIAAAGGAAHLPGMVAALTPLPVIGVPIETQALKGKDSLLSIVQMPAGIPVATMAIGKAGAANAAILATQILALHNQQLANNLQAFRAQQTQSVLANPDPRQA